MYRSKIFLTCILDFFSSAFEGPAAGASDEEEEAAGPEVVLARFAGGA